MRILFVDHPYHRTTRSSDCILGPLSSGSSVEVLYHNTYESELPLPRLHEYDAAVFWQVPPRQEHPNLTWVPMYDSIALSRSGFRPLPLPALKYLCLCRRLYGDASSQGLNARCFQYWPDPGPMADHSEPALFFWYRTPGVTWGHVKTILGGFRVARVFIKNNPDPGFEKMRVPAGDRARYRIEETDSFLRQDEYDRILAEHNISVASRPFEGIGLTTLELMRRGYCVVALDRPTASEYIVPGATGILLREFAPADLSNHAALGRAAREAVAAGSRAWRSEREGLLDYVRTPPAGGG